MKSRLLHLGAFVGALLLAGGAAPLAAQSPETHPERQAIEAMLKQSLEKGYREENIEAFLSAYAPEARIVNYLWGVVDRETFGRKTAEDFAVLGNQKVRVDLLEAEIGESEARAAINLSMVGDLEGGRRANRHDRYYLLLKKQDGAWRIVQQSYRPDFGYTPRPHGRP